MLSVVIPAYNEEENVAAAAQEISTVLVNAEIDFELVFVNDGSKDGTWAEIMRCAALDGRVRGVCFSRNFGKESAIFAGLAQAAGDCCVVIDCDLQHPPEKIVEMFRLWQEGYDVVEGIKADRGKESAAHSFAAKLFYRIISKASKLDMEHASDFKLLDRKVVNVLLNMPEKHAFFRALSSWVGFETAQVTYDVRERKAGESKWTTRSLAKYAITNITSFSAAPMQIITVLGVIVFVFSLVLGVWTLIQKICGAALGGFTTVIIMIGFIGSMLMISLGIIGYYIEKIYEEIKGRPRYIISCVTPEYEEED